MAPIDTTALTTLLTNGHDTRRSIVAGKQLTLAFAGLYIAETTLTDKPLLVWETETVYYARYYVPVGSLHPSIKAQLGHGAANGNGDAKGNGNADVDVKLEAVESVKGKGGAEAVIERLSVGGKSTTWTRFTEGGLKGFVRFEKDEIDDWFENGAIFNGIKSPYKRIDTKPVSRHVLVKIDGEVVAESNVPVLLTETGLKEAYYLPATSIKNWGWVEKSGWKTECPYKGEAWYFTLNIKGKKYENAVWYYMYPTHESSGVEGFVSFYNREGVDILVDGVKI